MAERKERNVYLWTLVSIIGRQRGEAAASRDFTSKEGPADSTVRAQLSIPSFFIR